MNMKCVRYLFASLLCVTVCGFASAEPRSTVSKIDSRSLELNEKAISLIKAKNFIAAEDLLKKSLDLDPKNVTAAFNLAGVYLAQKQTREAISLLQSYTTQSIQDAGVYARLGDAYFADKNIVSALQSYQKAKSLAPKYSGLSAKLGTVYALTNNYPEAEKAFREAVTANQKDGQSLSNLSSVLLANGKADEAVRTAKRALQISPTSDVYVTLGNAYEQLKDKKNALIAFERAADLGSEAQGLNDKIKELKASS